MLDERFEDGLSISVLKTTATHHQNFQLEIVKSSQKSQFLKVRSPVLFHTRPFANSRMHSNRSRLAVPALVRVY
jgi:hypothetical protein